MGRLCSIGDIGGGIRERGGLARLIIGSDRRGAGRGGGVGRERGSTRNCSLVRRRSTPDWSRGSVRRIGSGLGGGRGSRRSGAEYRLLFAHDSAL